jgi:hypothetical protein
MTRAVIASNLTPVLEVVEYVGACASCDLSSGPWGWCLHYCERIYPNPIVWIQQMAAKKRVD